MCWQQGLELAEEVVLSTQHIFLSYSSLSIYYSSQHITVSLHNTAESLNMYVFCFLMCCLKCKSATCGYFRIYLNLKHHCEAWQKYRRLLFFTPNYFLKKVTKWQCVFMSRLATDNNILRQSFRTTSCLSAKWNTNVEVQNRLCLVF